MEASVVEEQIKTKLLQQLVRCPSTPQPLQHRDSSSSQRTTAPALPCHRQNSSLRRRWRTPSKHACCCSTAAPIQFLRYRFSRRKAQCLASLELVTMTTMIAKNFNDRRQTTSRL
ncbi:hypothetical protein ACFX2C_044193 [Malus domestica]